LVKKEDLASLYTGEKGKKKKKRGKQEEKNPKKPNLLARRGGSDAKRESHDVRRYWKEKKAECGEKTGRSSPPDRNPRVPRAKNEPPNTNNSSD